MELALGILVYGTILGLVILRDIPATLCIAVPASISTLIATLIFG